MADERNPRAAHDESTNEPAERHGVEGWRERARQFRHGDRRVDQHAIAGALHDVKPNGTLTAEQVQARLDKFLAPVKEPK